MLVNIHTALEKLEGGEVVAFPTETVYGLGARLDNPSAIERIFETKGRPSDNPLIVHIRDIAQAEPLVREIPGAVKKLMEAYWPGPLTIVLPRTELVPDRVAAGLDTVALRVPAHPAALELLAKSGPLVAPSANPSGRPSPTRANHVEHDYAGRVPVLDGGETRIGLESTVLDCTETPFRILRPGALDAHSLSRTCGHQVLESADDPSARRSPGTRHTHYKPAADVLWAELDSTGELHPISSSATRNALLLLHRAAEPFWFRGRVIHYGGDYTRFASQLYDLFRWADTLGLPKIYIEPFTSVSPVHPLIPALLNRIEKAAGQ